jgi:hypothetical protein
MASIKNWIAGGAPVSWGDVVMRSVTIAVLGFATLCLKDGLESGDWGDWVSPLTDASAIAGAVFVLNALLKRRSA